jgi:hypothetical protein
MSIRIQLLEGADKKLADWTLLNTRSSGVTNNVIHISNSITNSVGDTTLALNPSKLWVFSKSGHEPGEQMEA